MVIYNKNKTINNKSKIYNYSLLIIYSLILISGIFFKIKGYENILNDLVINTMYLGLLFSIIGIFIPKNRGVWAHIIIPIIINIPIFLSLLAVTHGDIIVVLSNYFESIISAPINILKIFI